MGNYNYSEHKDIEDPNRFGRDVIGYHIWERQLENPTSKNLVELHDLGRTQNHTCPRVFISHKSVDYKYALRIANLANNNGFYYWLDILDPTLKNVNQGVYSPNQTKILIATIIELALINCTHVLAVFTKNTKGSLWVPYEYGRITAIPNNFDKACAWIKSNKLKEPEYFLFGKRCYLERHINMWFQKEFGNYTLCSKKKIPWNKPKTKELPFDKGEETE